jgi:hypothetical protein
MGVLQPFSTEQGQGSTYGHENVAVAYCIDWVAGSTISAMIVAPVPFPYAVTIPAVAPALPPEFVSTGKTLGKEDSQIAEFVTSRTTGATV